MVFHVHAKDNIPETCMNFENSEKQSYFDCPYLRNFIISTFDSGQANDVPREIFRNVL